MNWNKYTIDTTVDAEDLISMTLSEMGIEGVEIEDNVPLTEAEKELMYVDILPLAKPQDGKARVSFYVKDEDDTEEYINSIKAGLMELSDFTDLGPMTFTKEVTREEDWMNNWKQYWKPFKVADDIWIKPSWETLEDLDEDTLVIELDPGSAFGTGTHHTTRLCIDHIRKNIKSTDTLLDVGCGSGILAIIASKLGAQSTKAIDIDVHAADVAVENRDMNGIAPEQMEVFAGNVLEDPQLQESLGQHDIVVANILADVIIPLNSIVKKNMKKGGIYITSGIIDTMEEKVHESLIENGFEVMEITRSGDWVSFLARSIDA